MKLTVFTLVLALAGSAPAQQTPPSPAPPAPAQQAQGAAPGEGAEEAEEAAPEAEPFPGTFAEGLREIARLAGEDAPEEALAVAERLLSPNAFARWRARVEEKTRGSVERALAVLDGPLAFFGLEPFTAADRAEVHYARGVVYAGTFAFQEADGAFELARVLAGPGATRLDAMYDLGTLDLIAGETWRAEIPEISGKAPAAPVPPLPGQAPEEAPDPLELARAAYLAAREHFVERLRADWRDADTRANVELVMRRLAELDDLEQEREEEEQEQQEQNEDDQQQQQDGDSSEDEQQEGEEDEEQEGEEEPEENEGEQEEEEQPEPQEGEDQEGEEEPAAEPDEKHLTQEEVKRLLEQLKELDEEGEEKRERLRGVRRQPVDKDW